MNFTTTSQASANSGIKALVYGPAGMGKTMLCATLPAPVIISAESGLLSLRPQNIARVFGENAQGICYDIPVIEVKTVQNLTEAYNWFTTSPQAANFQSIAIDSLSEIAEVVLNNAKRQVKDPRQAYGELLEKMETLIRLFRDLPNKNVVMMAKMESYKEELTGIVKYGPSMPGSKLGQKLPYFFDEVFRLGVNKDAQGMAYRFLQTQPDLQFEAKDRSGSLDPVEFPNLTYVLNKIIGV